MQFEVGGDNMRKLISSIILAGITILMLIPVQPLQPVQQVHAIPGYEEYLTVRYRCITGPDMRGTIEGEWFRDCDGNMSGWGVEPGSDCTYTDVTFGASCSGPSYPQEEKQDR